MIDISKFQDAFLPFSARRLKSARTVWLNADSSWNVRPVDISTTDWVIEHLSYAIPDEHHFPHSIFVENSQKTVLAERYGGAGLGQNGGGGRSAIIDGVSVKGCGRNPLVGKGTDEWHSYGGLSLVDAAIEAINSEVFNHVLPRGAIRSLAIVLTGVNTAFMPSGRHDQGPGALLIRELCPRPAHYLPAMSFEKSAAHPEGMLVDSERTRRVNLELCANLGGHSKAIELVGSFLSAYAEQFAFARLFRIYHGALSPSNISFDGRWLDLGNASFVTSGLNFAPSTAAPSFHTELFCGEAYARDFIKAYTENNSTNFNTEPLTAFFHSQVEAFFHRHALSVFGLSGELSKESDLTEQYGFLIEHLENLCEGERLTVNASPVGSGYVDEVALFLERLFLPQGVGPESDILRRAFHEVMQQCYRNAEGYGSYGTFVRCTAIESLRKTYFCHLFTRNRLLADILNLVATEDAQRLSDYIDNQIALSRWVFPKQPGETAVLFESRELAIGLHRKSGCYRIGTQCGELLEFEHASSVLSWMEQQGLALLCIDNQSVADELKRILEVLTKAESSSAYHDLD